MGRQTAEKLHRDLLKEREGKRAQEEEQRPKEQVSEDRQGDRLWRTYIVIYISMTSLKTEGETESGDPTEGSLKREKGREKKAIAEI